MKYKVGQLVLNNKLGLGKVLELSGSKVTTFFRNETENPRVIDVSVVPMDLAAEQSDPWFDGRDDLVKLKAHQRSERAPVRKSKKTKDAAVVAG